MTFLLFCLECRFLDGLKLQNFGHPYPYEEDINWGLQELFGYTVIRLEMDSHGKRRDQMEKPT